MTRADENLYGRDFAWCLGEWPALRAHVPEDWSILDLGFGRGVGICTDPEAADDSYVHSRGGRKFVGDESVPDGFFWSGFQDRGGSEYVFAMWRAGARWFWFYDQYVVFFGGTGVSTERTAERLAAALGRWENGDPAVIYSGLWGWYRVASRRFERDRAERSTEDWDRT